MLMPVLTDVKDKAGLDQSEIGFTCSGSTDYLAGQAFSFVMTLDGVGACPPISESHVEMDGAWALYEAWVKLQIGEIDTALVYSYGKSSPGSVRDVLSRQLDPYYVGPLWPDAVALAALPGPGRARRGHRDRGAMAEVAARSRHAAANNPKAQLASSADARGAPGRGLPRRAAPAPRLPADLRRRRRSDPRRRRPGPRARTTDRPGSAASTTASRPTSSASATSRRRRPPARRREGGRRRRSGRHRRDPRPVHPPGADPADALGLGDDVDVNPSGGALAANPLMAAGLIRIGEAADRISSETPTGPSPTPPRARACNRTWSASWKGKAMSERVAIVGIGQTKHEATRGDVSIAGLVREAALRALEDANMTWADIDAVVIGKAPDFFEGVMMPELYLADALGAVGKPMLRVHTAGSVGGSTAIVATSLVESGVHERVLTVAFEKQSESEAMWALSLPIPFQPPLVAGAGGYFAPHIRTYMRRSGAPDHIGILVALKDRLNALKNPYAHLHEHDITFDSVKDAMMLWDPIRYTETCPSSDGACAMVITNEASVGSPRRHRPGCSGVRCAPSRPCTRAATRSTPSPVASAPRRSTRRPASPTLGRRSTWSRCTCRSPGTSRCGSRTSASPSWARAGSSPRRASRRWTATCRSTARAACCRPTPSARPA